MRWDQQDSKFNSTNITAKREEDQIQWQTTASPSCHILAGLFTMNRTLLHFLGQIYALERFICRTFWKVHSMFNEVRLLLQLLGALHNENNHNNNSGLESLLSVIKI